MPRPGQKGNRKGGKRGNNSKRGNNKSRHVRDTSTVRKTVIDQCDRRDVRKAKATSPSIRRVSAVKDGKNKSKSNTANSKSNTAKSKSNTASYKFVPVTKSMINKEVIDDRKNIENEWDKFDQEWLENQQKRRIKKILTDQVQPGKLDRRMKSVMKSKNYEGYDGMDVRIKSQKHLKLFKKERAILSYTTKRILDGGKDLSNMTRAQRKQVKITASNIAKKRMKSSIIMTKLDQAKKQRK